MRAVVFALCFLSGDASGLGAESPVTESGPMIHVAAGPFFRGAPETQGDPDEHPQRQIYISGFSIDQFEVTNRQYQAFVQASGHRTPEHCCDTSYNLWTGATVLERQLDHPVTNVDWFDAQAFCAWAKKRLPTEAEWEKAARGSQGRLFPWGDVWDPRKVNGAAYWAGRDFETADGAKAWWADAGNELLGQKGDHGMLTLPVSALPEGATPEGVMHLAGNVWEWTADWYEATYYELAPDRDPGGPAEGAYKVTRGGSWLNHRHLLRTTARDGARPSMRNHGTGFRCARSD